MKKVSILYSALILGLSILLAACSSTQQAVSQNDRDTDPYQDKRVIEINNPLTLEDFLLRAPGVFVRGNQVSIRGGGPPLFIIDNVPVGHNYLSAKAAVNPLDIVSVEVLSGPDTAIYGRQGGNGVIIIRTTTF